jgi:hypothetical protein
MRPVPTVLSHEGVALADASSGAILVVAPEPELLWWKERIEGFDQVQPAVTRNYVPRRFDLGETARLVEAVVKGEGAWRMVAALHRQRRAR